jgi:methionyl-tRNA formyltransferase
MTGRASPSIAFFGTPSQFSGFALERLTARWNVVAIVLPNSGGRRQSVLRRIGLQPLSAVERLARKRGVPTARWLAGDEGLAPELLRRTRPDLICVAGFPRLIPSSLISDAPIGAINLHPSLLPRHRGPLPLFWTYHGDDRVAGVTVHHLTERYDAGDIVAQRSFPLPRGYPVKQLDDDVARHGATLLDAAVEALAANRAQRIVQDEGAATPAPWIQRGNPMVNFGEWDVERVWHFLAGLCPGFREPLTDREGTPVIYSKVLGFDRGATATAGSVENAEGGWRLYCRGGTVLLGR